MIKEWRDIGFPIQSGDPEESVCSGSGAKVCGTGSVLHIQCTRKDCGFDFLASRGCSAGSVKSDNNNLLDLIFKRINLSPPWWPFSTWFCCVLSSTSLTSSLSPQYLLPPALSFALPLWLWSNCPLKMFTFRGFCWRFYPKRPFIHTVTHRRRSQPHRATASSSGAVRGRCLAQRHSSNLTVTSQPATSCATAALSIS